VRKSGKFWDIIGDRKSGKIWENAVYVDLKKSQVISTEIDPLVN